MSYIIPDVAPRVHYTATAAQTVFAVPFRFASDELEVYVNGTLATYSASPADATQFSTTGEDEEDGGSITFGAPGLSLGDEVAILRDIPVERSSDFPATGRFPITDLNNELFRLTAMIQQVEMKLDQRGLRLSTFDQPETLSNLPAKATRAGQLLGFDDDGQPVASDGAFIDTAKAAAEAAQTAAEAAQTAAEAAQSGAEAAQAVVEAEAARASFYDTVAAAEAASVPASTDILRLSGHSAVGDNAGTLTFKEAASEPAHSGKINTANGRWFEITADGMQMLKVEAFPGADLGAKFAAAIEAVKDIRETGSGVTWHPDTHGILIPPRKYVLSTPIELVSCSNLVVGAYGSTISDGSSADYLFRMVNSSNVRINGLSLNCRGNIDASQGVLVAGQCSYSTFTDLAVQIGNTDAAFASVRMKQGDTSGIDDDARSKGSFWVTFDRPWVRVLTGGDTVAAVGIDAQGCQNALRVINGRFNSVTNGVLVQNQNGSTLSGISNDVQIFLSAFEGGIGTACMWQTTDAGDGIAGGTISHCRFESLDYVAGSSGFGSVSTPITLIGNTIISDVTGYIAPSSSTTGFAALDHSITPNFVESKWQNAKGLWIRNTPVAAGVPALRVNSTGSSNNGSITLTRTDGITHDFMLSQRAGGGWELGNTSSSRTGRINTLIGLSGTTTHASNLRGTVTVSGGGVTGTNTFTIAEVDTSYRVILTPVSSTGTPAAGSNRVLSVSKATGSFTVTVEVDPGVGNSVTFDWMLVR